MKILHVVNIYFAIPFFFGGQFKYFSDKGHKFYVACSPSKYLKEYSQTQGFDYIETPVTRSITIWQDIKSIKTLCSFIKQKKIDVIVGHTPKGGLLSMIAGAICRVPKRIYFRHGLVYETSHGLKRQILIAADRLTSLCATKIICVSPSVLSRSIQDHLAPANKQSVLGHGTCNGIDTINKYNPDRIDQTRLNALRRKYGIDTNDYIIGYSGRLVKDKGINDLVNAFDSLKNSENCKLLFVGMFEERDALPEELKQRILNDKRIIFTGFINEYIEYYYSLMDMYVLPSYREGFPTGVLEAQAMGIPVVTTRVTGCCDSILDGITGLFADNDPVDLASKIDAIRLDKRIDGKKGREWVIDNFDSRLVWKEIEKIY